MLFPNLKPGLCTSCPKWGDAGDPNKLWTIAYQTLPVFGAGAPPCEGLFQSPRASLSALAPQLL